MHEVKIDVVHTQALEGRVNALGNPVVPGVVQLGGYPDLFTRNAGVADTIANLGLIAISQGTVIVSMDISRDTINGSVIITHVSMCR